MRSGIPPWHMWGNTQVIEVNDTFGVNTPATAGQMLRISYLRPETWHWVFFARLLEARDTAAGESIICAVSFNLTVGIGRSQITIPNFEQYAWNWGSATVGRTAPLDFLKYSTSSNGRIRIDNSEQFGGGQLDPWQIFGPANSIGGSPNGSASTRSLSNPIEQIVAQDIQLDIAVSVSTFGGPVTAKVEVSAQFSPNVHIRPEWFAKGRYPGAEDGGSEAGSIEKQLEQLNKAKASDGDPGQPDGSTGLQQYDDQELQRNRDALERLERSGHYIDPDDPDAYDGDGYGFDDDDEPRHPPPRPPHRRRG